MARCVTIWPDAATPVKIKPRDLDKEFGLLDCAINVETHGVAPVFPRSSRVSVGGVHIAGIRLTGENASRVVLSDVEFGSGDVEGSKVDNRDRLPHERLSVSVLRPENIMPAVAKDRLRANSKGTMTERFAVDAWTLTDAEIEDVTPFDDNWAHDRELKEFNPRGCWIL